MPEPRDQTSEGSRRLVSYAQNAEDIVLFRALGHVEGGFFVDVGANEPTHDSVTKLFHDRGWTGVNIEPQLSCFENLCRERLLDTNLNIGVGSAVGELTLYIVPEAKAMSTFSSEQADRLKHMGYHTRQAKVEVKRLIDVFEQHVGERDVEFLKVDVEGLEEEVLGTFDWQKWRPKVVVVESYPEVAPWEKRLLANGYQRTLWDGINLFFVRDEDADTIGPRLRQPATIVLDRYDPWLYLEQVEKAQQQLVALLTDHLVVEFGKRTDPTEESIAAARALGEVLSKRRDVTEHFNGPPGEDVSALLQWAANPDRQAELFGGELVQFAALYRGIAFAPVRRGSDAGPQPTGVVAKLYGRLKLALPTPARHKLGSIKRRFLRRFQ